MGVIKVLLMLVIYAIAKPSRTHQNVSRHHQRSSPTANWLQKLPKILMPGMFNSEETSFLGHFIELCLLCVHLRIRSCIHVSRHEKNVNCQLRTVNTRPLCILDLCSAHYNFCLSLMKLIKFIVSKSVYDKLCDSE